LENNEFVTNSLDYPYGMFPYNYTKSGQKQLKEKMEEVSTQSVTTLSQPEPQKSGLDISKLLPLFSIMNNKKSLSQADMLKLFLPLLTGKEIDISELMKSMESPQDVMEAEDVPDDKVGIASYKKIE